MLYLHSKHDAWSMGVLLCSALVLCLKLGKCHSLADTGIVYVGKARQPEKQKECYPNTVDNLTLS